MNELHVLTRSIAAIKIPHEREACQEAVVEELMESIPKIGLLQPIVISADGTLIAGRHRLEACRRLGWELIPCRIFQGAPAIRELAEIDENLMRRELSALERSQLLARRKTLYEQLYPETAKGAAQISGMQAKTNGANGNGHKNGNGAVKSPETPTFAEATAKATGKSLRTVQEETALGQAISSEAAKALQQTPVADQKGQLKKLAKLPEDQQVEVANTIKAGKAATVDEAAEASGVAVATPAKGKTKKDTKIKAQRALAVLIRCLSKLGLLDEYQEILQELRGRL
jgi:ParB-like chromosome segregation protein Spo0J